MEKHCVLVNYSVRKSKKNKEGLSPIECSITYNGERIYFVTGKSVLASDWIKDKQIVRGKTEKAKLINDYLVQFRNKIYQKEVELMQRGFLITCSLLKEAVLDKVEDTNDKTLLQLIVSHNVEKYELIGKTVAEETFYCFEYSRRLLEEFIKEKYGRADIYLKEIKLGFIQSFHTFLITKKKMSQNTTTKHLVFLKKMMNLAIANSYLTFNPISIYKIEREKVEIDFLDQEELRKIVNFDSTLERLERAKDMFLFGCFTGLAYIDIKTLSKENIVKDDEGRLWIKKKRIKTGVLSRIPLLPMAKMILDKYKGKEKLLPIQDPSDVNRYLKDIAVLCGITKNITFHTSRHTFASTVTLANNISIEVVAKMMGHTNTRMTNHYAKLVDNCIAEQMDKLTDQF